MKVKQIDFSAEEVFFFPPGPVYCLVTTCGVATPQILVYVCFVLFLFHHQQNISDPSGRSPDFASQGFFSCKPKVFDFCS